MLETFENAYSFKYIGSLTHYNGNLYFSGYNGADGLPDTITADETYTYTFPTYTVPVNYNAAKMRAIVLLIETVTGEIRNANGANLINLSTATASIAKEQAWASISPNPVRNFLWCELKAAFPKGQLRVFNLVGELQLNMMLAGGRNEINITSLTSGIYLAEVTTTGKASRLLFFKE